MTRAAALELVERDVENLNLRRHMLACEAIMRALASRLDEDVDLWGLAGLVHDIDVEHTTEDATRHGLEAAADLQRLGAPDEVTHAVSAHNAMTGVLAQTRMDIALVAADQLSGLVTAAALVRPDKSLAGVGLKSLRKRFRESAFARGVDRQAIDRCTEIGLERDDFMQIGLTAMQGIAADLGL
jgi:hypothetical protein